MIMHFMILQLWIFQKERAFSNDNEVIAIKIMVIL